METRVHVSLDVSDLERSIEFYSKLFQTGPTKVQPGYANFRLETPQLHLALVHSPGRAPEPTTGSNRHYGIELFQNDKLETWLKAARTSGLVPRVEENVTCCYAVADKFWAKDPDGHDWEFWVRQAEADTMHGQTVEKAAPACCAPGTCC